MAVMFRGVKPWRGFAIRQDGLAPRRGSRVTILRVRDNYPVSGVSWFEAGAYATFAKKQLPVLSQWFQTAPPDVSRYTIPASNITSGSLAPVGAYRGIGPYGTYDTAGNVREWVANTVDNDLHFILGGSWKSPAYLYFSPEALSPFDRSEENGFRCVQNLGPMPEEAAKPVTRQSRDFAHYKPVSDNVFRAYELLYAYPKTNLNAKVEGIVKETEDWRQEKVSFDTAYRGERMSAYLFLPKNVRPPYQTVLFFPSARVDFISDNKNGRELGDIKFFDYVVQSGPRGHVSDLRGHVRTAREVLSSRRLTEYSDHYGLVQGCCALARLSCHTTGHRQQVNSPTWA